MPPDPAAILILTELLPLDCCPAVWNGARSVSPKGVLNLKDDI